MAALGRKPAYAWPDWYRALSAYEGADPRRVAWQLLHTLVPYFALWYAMARALERGNLVLYFALIVPAAGLLVRSFIFFHECAHGSLFASRRANAAAGLLLGALSFTPFADWRRTHLIHHRTYANLDARGAGDLRTMTVAEYAASSRPRRLGYRVYRNPLALFVVGPLYYFVARQRFPARGAGPRERRGVLWTDLCVAGMATAGYWALGWRTYLLIQVPVLWLAGAAGVWLFYVQHQFEGVYWARTERWDPLRAAFDGSSFYHLPPVLRWLSGSIGFHFLHHLRPRIPNYRLKRCYDEVPELRTKEPLTLGKSLSAWRLKLWDEEEERLTGFPLRPHRFRGRPFCAASVRDGRSPSANVACKPVRGFRCQRALSRAASMPRV